MAISHSLKWERRNAGEDSQPSKKVMPKKLKKTNFFNFFGNKEEHVLCALCGSLNI